MHLKLQACSRIRYRWWDKRYPIVDFGLLDGTLTLGVELARFLCPQWAFRKKHKRALQLLSYTNPFPCEKFSSLFCLLGTHSFRMRFADWKLIVHAHHFLLTRFPHYTQNRLHCHSRCWKRRFLWLLFIWKDLFQFSRCLHPFRRYHRFVITSPR